MKMKEDASKKTISTRKESYYEEKSRNENPASWKIVEAENALCVRAGS